MSKKIFLTGFLLIGATVAGLYLYQPASYSATDAPNLDPRSCQASWQNEMALMKKGWSDHLDQLLSQEKPTSDLVDEAFSSLRTYQCWLQYLCHAVRMSGLFDPRSVGNLQEKSYTTFLKVIPIEVDRVPTIPGCAPLTDIKIPGTELGYMPLCATAKGKASSDESTSHYNKCREDYLREFAPPTAAQNPEETINRSPALITLETAIRANAYNKKSTIVAKKINTILDQMSALGRSFTLMHDLMKKLADRVPCFPNKCD